MSVRLPSVSKQHEKREHLEQSLVEHWNPLVSDPNPCEANGFWMYPLESIPRGLNVTFGTTGAASFRLG